MGLIVEEIVEEWLRRRGFFTIRGVRVGNNEMDLLALRLTSGRPECWHYEVQGSFRAMSFITSLPREVQRATGKRPRNAANRPLPLLQEGVHEWVERKFRGARLEETRRALCRAEWKFAFVFTKVRHAEELPLIREHGIEVLPLDVILRQLESGERMEEGILQGAAGYDLVDLAHWEHFLGRGGDAHA